MSEPLDLNIDLTQTDTSYPLLAETTAAFRVTKAEVVEKKDDSSKHNLKVESATTAENEQRGGGTINPGYTLTKYFPLQPSDNDKAPDFQKGLAELVDALFNPTSDADRPVLSADTIAAMPGKEFLGTVKIRGKIEDEYGIQNELKRMMAIG